MKLKKFLDTIKYDDNIIELFFENSYVGNFDVYVLRKSKHNIIKYYRRQQVDCIYPVGYGRIQVELKGKVFIK